MPEPGQHFRNQAPGAVGGLLADVDMRSVAWYHKISARELIPRSEDHTRSRIKYFSFDPTLQMTRVISCGLLLPFLANGEKRVHFNLCLLEARAAPAVFLSLSLSLSLCLLCALLFVRGRDQREEGGGIFLCKREGDEETEMGT